MFFFLIQLLIVLLGKKQAFQFDASHGIYSSWNIDRPCSSCFSTCGGKQILGGYGVFDMTHSITEKISKFIIMVTSNCLLIIKSIIDSWDNDYFNILLDKQLFYSEQFSSSNGAQICGSSSKDEIIQISIPLYHTQNYINVYMDAWDQNNDNNEYWGISLFTISVEPCPDGCDYCESNSFTYCRSWYS